MFSYYFHRISGWVTFAIVIVVFLIGLQVVGWIRRDVLGYGPQTASQQHAQQPVQHPNAGPPTGITSNPSQSSSASTTQVQKPARVVPSGPSPAEIREELQAARDRLVESNVHVDQALKSIKDWDSEILPLLDTSAGDKISAHEDLLTSLTRIVKEERIPAAKIRDKAKRIDTLRSQLGKRATASTPKPLSDQEQTEIDELHTAVSTADQNWSDALSNARAIKLLADTRVDPEKQRTLKEEIDVKAAEQKLADFEEQQRLENERKTREAEEQRKREELAAERKRERERLEAQRKEEAKALAADQRRKEAELLARARSANVKTTLAPFLHSRSVQPRKAGGSVQFRATFDEKPMSLAALQGMGALAPSVDGLKMLAKIGGNRKLPEPRWSVYSQPGNWSEDDKKLLKEAQQMLRELGATLVKEEMLSP